ncbi:hypothetical protein F4775DRAFT_579190 [Biscogniauxia sp. FL1348]|nr:hypothetical protein F4775DRAFT_579190 [Biscogniauxia sp. FL1348]
MKFVHWWASLYLWGLFAGSAFSQAHFREWFPQYRPDFTSIIRDNCSSVYHDYATGNTHGDLSKSATSAPVVACILSFIDEAGKANLASAGVILGLLPTMLSITGSTTNELGLIALRRPVLSLLLAAGAPSVNALRTFEQPEQTRLLLEPSPFRTLYPLYLSPRAQTLVSTVQYLISLGAIANLIEATYEISTRTNVSWSTETVYLPGFWASLTVLIHIAGAAAMHLRIKIIKQPASDTSRGNSLELCPRWLKEELVPSISQPIRKAETRQATWWFLILSWGVSAATFWHIIFGTCIFSGILFISTQDAWLVFARYWISTLCCRLIVMFEFHGMRVSLATNGDNTRGIPMESQYEQLK